MATAVNIVLNDAAATPVAHTFQPTGKDAKGVMWFEELGVATATIGNNRISMELVRSLPPASGSNSGDRVNRVKVTLHMPVLETLGTNDNGILPPPTVAYISRASGGEYILPERSSLQNRKDLRKMNYELQNNAQVIAAVESLIGVW